MDTIQWIFVFAVLTGAAGYAALRIYRVLNRVQNPCDGCEGCPLKGQKARNKDFCEKK